MTNGEAPVRRIRKSRSFRSVALGGAVLGLLIVAVAASLYVRFIRYERVAARHVPAGSVMALRVDVEQAMVYEPVRRHLVPLLGGPSSSPAEQEARLLRLEARSTIRRGDLREIVVAWGAEPATWVVVLGGIFPGSGIVLLAEALRAESPDWVTDADGAAVVNRASGLAVGRGRDRTVLLASSDEELRRSLLPGAEYDRLGLVPTGAGSVAAGAEGLRRLSALPAVAAMGELASALPRLAKVGGDLQLGDRLTLTLRGEGPQTGGAAGVAALTLAGMEGLGRAPNSMGDVLGNVAERTTVTYPDGRSAVMALVWEREEVDEAAEAVAQAIGLGIP